MLYRMNIPTDIPSCINPEIQDPVSKSVLYKFRLTDYTIDKDGDLLYKFPYSKDTFWTNFRYACHAYNGDCAKQFNIGIILVTSDGYTYNISDKEPREQLKWLDTMWPIPSTNTKEGGIYFKVTRDEIPDLDYEISIMLLGFEDLFPKVENYILLSPFDTYQWVFSKFEKDEEGVSGSIYNVEHYDYIRDIVNKACGIRLIKRY